jgi:hypothetical protein
MMMMMMNGIRSDTVPLKKDEQSAVVYSKLLSRCEPTGIVKESIKTSGKMASTKMDASRIRNHTP